MTLDGAAIHIQTQIVLLLYCTSDSLAKHIPAFFCGEQDDQIRCGATLSNGEDATNYPRFELLASRKNWEFWKSINKAFDSRPDRNLVTISDTRKMSTGRSPPASLQQALGSESEHKRQKLESDNDNEGAVPVPVLIGGIDSAIIARLPRRALLDIVLQTLPTSTALKAIVLDKLTTESLLEPGESDDEYAEEEDADATDLEDLSGEEAESSQQSDQPVESGPLAGLSVLAKLIMEIMNSAPAPEGGMPWREFEGIWPPVMGTVEDAVKECISKGMLKTVNGNNEFVVSTMPMVETILEE